MKGDRWSIQPSLLFTLAPQTELLLRGQYDRRSQLEYSGLPARQVIDGRIDRGARPGLTGQPRTTIENRLATAELRHGFSDDVRLTVTGRFYDSDFDEYGSFVYPAFFPAAATPTSYPLLKAHLPTRVKEGTAYANLLASVGMRKWCSTPMAMTICSIISSIDPAITGSNKRCDVPERQTAPRPDRLYFLSAVAVDSVFGASAFASYLAAHPCVDRDGIVAIAAKLRARRYSTGAEFTVDGGLTAK